jgi:hypothetical protein
MPSTDRFLEQQPDPWRAFAQAAHWLLGVGVHCALGVAIGALAARQIRSRQLHWSWAAVALAPVVLVRTSLGSSALTLLIAALLATIRTRRWHRDDLEIGADLARIAADRRSPLKLVRSIAESAKAVCEREPSAVPQQLALGRDDSGRVVAIPFGDHGGGRHTLVVGATGSGKTVTQTWIAVSAVRRGMGAVVVDPKGDRGMRSELRRAAHAAGRSFLEWTPAGDCIYNPYARGSDTEIADKALAGERFTEPHYLRQAQRYLGHAVRTLRAADCTVSLVGIVEHLDPDRLEVLARCAPERVAQLTHAYLDSLSARQRSDLAGVRDRLAILAESDVGRWIDPRTENAQRLDLLDAVRAGAVVYFSLESDRRPLLTQMLGAAIVQDLQTVVAELQQQPIATLVVIDEFSAVAAERVVGLFGRARSAGMSLLLATQELADLRLPGQERLLEQIMGNLSVVLAHRQVVPASAELISNVAGGHGAWKVSRHSDGRTTRSRTRQAALDVDQIMGLGAGRAAVIVLGDVARVRIASVFSAQTRP